MSDIATDLPPNVTEPAQLQNTITTHSATMAHVNQSLHKSAIRSIALAHRNSIQRSIKKIKSDIYDKLILHLRIDVLAPIYPLHSKPVVAGYYPIGSEFDVLPLLQRLYGFNHTIALPVVQDDCDVYESPLVFWDWIPGSETTKGKFNIPIPIREQAHSVRPDLLFVPVVAFDTDGRRLGYGGGYYDRAIETLRRCRRNLSPTDKSKLTEDLTLLICGVGFDDQKRFDLNELDQGHDQKMDIVITEKSIYICSRELKNVVSSYRAKQSETQTPKKNEERPT